MAARRGWSTLGMLGMLALGLTVAGGSGCAETRDAAKQDGGTPKDGGMPKDGGGDHDAASLDAGGAGDGGGPSCEPLELHREPGPALLDLEVAGSGPCAGTTLGTAIGAVHAAHPALDDVRELFGADANRRGDQSYVYAFGTRDGGFALVFRRGAGDCPAGCTENTYFYFRTDESCAPQAVGSYAPSFDAAGCVAVEGLPLWDHPPPPDPRDVCGVDAVARGVGGDYAEPACGQRTPCSTQGGTDAHVEALDLELRFAVEQDPDDPARATLTLLNTGHPALDGRPLDATVERRLVHVVEQVDNLPAVCIEQHELEVVIDLDGYSESFVHYFEVQTPDCDGAPGDICKGGLQLDLGNLGAKACSLMVDFRDLVAREQALHARCAADDDCALVSLDGNCFGQCVPAVVSADHADTLAALVEQAGDAYCADSTCSLDSDCSAVEPACEAGRCALRRATH